MQRGDWRYILLALGLQSFWVLNLATSFWTIYRSLGIDETLKRLYLMVSVANFINVIATSGGVGSLAVFILGALTVWCARPALVGPL